MLISFFHGFRSDTSLSLQSIFATFYVLQEIFIEILSVSKEILTKTSVFFLLGNIKITRNIKKYEFIKHIKAASFFRLTYSHPIIKPLAKIYKTSIANILKKRFNPLHFNVFHLFQSFFSIPNNQNNTYIYQTFNLALLCTIFIPSIGFTRIDSIDRSL